MITVRVYDNYNSIALQTVDTDDLEGFEFCFETSRVILYDENNFWCHYDMLKRKLCPGMFQK